MKVSRYSRPQRMVPGSQDGPQRRPQEARPVRSGQVRPRVPQEAVATLLERPPAKTVQGSWGSDSLNCSPPAGHSAHGSFLSTYYVSGMRISTGLSPRPHGTCVLRAEPPPTGAHPAHVPGPGPGPGSGPSPDTDPDPRPQTQTQTPDPRPQTQTPDPDPRPRPQARQSQPPLLAPIPSKRL